jgi:uncharacterized membrane protein (UPF0127 family)
MINNNIKAQKEDSKITSQNIKAVKTDKVNKNKISTYRYIVIGTIITLAVFFIVAVLLLLFPSLIINNVYKIPQNQLLNIFPVREIALVNNMNNSKKYYYVYIAATPKLMMQGYMNSTTLGNCDNKGNCLGMLFLFNTSQNICMWMKNTEIPLKQVWFNSNGIAVYEVNATPYSTNTICHYGQFVLETNRSIPLNNILEAP